MDTKTRSPPQAFVSSYAPRLRMYSNSLLTPVLPTIQAGPISRTTKRGTTIINYAEDGFEDYDDDDDDRRRPTGLRSLRKEDSRAMDLAEKYGKEVGQPVGIQGIWRDWMGKARNYRADNQTGSQAELPVTLIPIRLDLEIPSFVPAAPFPQPGTHIDPSLPQYRAQEMTVPYRLRDFFLWNLHETLITTDQFAQILVQDLDLPNRQATIQEISKQIRTQLEEYAGVALHPLFHAVPTTETPLLELPKEDSATPGLSRLDSPPQNGGTPRPNETSVASIQAEATPVRSGPDELNPDDTYRCILSLNINLGSTLYTDRFEWSLMHPPGAAEAFAKQTCADVGLTGEWIPALSHAIYEAVLRLKKEACESGGLVSGWGGLQGGEGPSLTFDGGDAGLRYNTENLGDEWEPVIEFLSKEDMEKREGDRERQVRRLRRETARFSSTAGMLGGIPFSGFGSFLDGAGASTPAGVGGDEERLGRGHRSRRPRRFRSLSPGGPLGTPGGRGTPDTGYGGGGGGGGVLMDQERPMWRCHHCLVWGTTIWAVRNGPAGARTLCNNCGFFWERDHTLPRHTKNMHAMDHLPA